jgi:hypothetical protein
MLKFLKMTAAEDVTITDVLVAEEALEAQEEKEILLQDAKVLEEVLEATEIQLQEKVVSEAIEIHLLLKEKVVLEAQLQETKEVLIELQDVLKALVIHQDQEDQEEINFNYLKYKIPNSRHNWNLGFFLCRSPLFELMSFAILIT